MKIRTNAKQLLTENYNLYADKSVSLKETFEIEIENEPVKTLSWLFNCEDMDIEDAHADAIDVDAFVNTL